MLVSVFVYKGAATTSRHGIPLGSTGRAFTHIFDLIAMVYIRVHGDGHGVLLLNDARML